MKKFICVVLVLLISTSIVFSAPISDSPEEYLRTGEILKNAGAIAGTDKGLGEMNKFTREQAIIILVNLLGYQDEAVAFQPLGIFEDVPVDHYAANYIEYAYFKGLTNGIGNNKFGLGLNVSQKSMASFMLKALNYSADWATEDIMAKAKELNITNDVGDGSNPIIRGQAFIYMANTLVLPRRLEDEMLAKTLGMDEKALAYVLEKEGGIVIPEATDTPEPETTVEETTTETTSQTNDGGEEKQVLKINFSKYPRPVKASTYLYDEFNVTFNVVLRTPTKDNFSFKVDGETIPESAWSISPSGETVSFRFNDQNLHGKTVECTVSGVESSSGNKMLSDAIITAEFKDFTPIEFVKVETIDKKTFKATLSVDVIPSGEEGYKVYSDGKLLTEKEDYSLGRGGKEFKVLFEKEEVYPKDKAKLEIWGYMTSPYHKFMDDPAEVEADFTEFSVIDIPLPEVSEPAPAVIVNEAPSIDVIQEAYEEENSGESLQNGSSCEPALIYDAWYVDDGFEVYTTKPIQEVKGAKLIESSGREVDLLIDTFTRSTPNGGEIYGFLAIPMEDRVGGARSIKVEEMIDAVCGAKTPPIEYQIPIN